MRGRPDYNLKVLPVPEVLGDDEEQFAFHMNDVLAPDATRIFYNQTLPADYELYITTYEVYCMHPGLNYTYVTIDDSLIVGGMFDVNYVFQPVGVGCWHIQSGETLKIGVHNYDNVFVIFGVTLRGYKKLLI